MDHCDNATYGNAACDHPTPRIPHAAQHQRPFAVEIAAPLIRIPI